MGTSRQPTRGVASSQRGELSKTIRTLVLLATALLALSIATPAIGATFVRLAATTVHRGGVLRLVGNANHMALYALPAARMRCARYGTCSGAPIHRTTPPKRPFVFLATTPSGPPRTREFAVRLPATLRPGRYKIFVWCKRCGDSLLIAGRDSSGQTLRVLR